MQPDAPTILSACRFFMRVKGPSYDRLKQMAVLKQYQAGQTIFRDGDECAGVFIVGSGLVRVYKLAPSGKEHVLHLVPPGGTFAEVAAIGEFNVPANAEAIEPTTCALLPMREFARAMKEDHQLCLQLMASMAFWVRHLLGMLEDIALRDAAGRVARYLLTTADARTGDVHLPSLKRHLASHLNLTSETLSRTLRRLAEMELIESDPDQSIRVLDREQLSALAEGLGPLL